MSFLFAFVFCTGMLADRLSKTPICIKFLTEGSSPVELTFIRVVLRVATTVGNVFSGRL